MKKQNTCQVVSNTIEKVTMRSRAEKALEHCKETEAATKYKSVRVNDRTIVLRKIKE